MCVQAQATQEANRAASNKWPPFWAIAAMVVLGFDEFVAVLYNPLWLVLALIIFLFGKTVYQVRLLSSSVAKLPCATRSACMQALCQSDHILLEQHVQYAAGDHPRTWACSPIVIIYCEWST